MKAYFAAKDDRYKQDEIALRQLRVLREHQGLREKKLRLSDVKAMIAIARSSRFTNCFSVPRQTHPRI
jgi:hypothetical protein